MNVLKTEMKKCVCNKQPYHLCSMICHYGDTLSILLTTVCWCLVELNYCLF